MQSLFNRFRSQSNPKTPLPTVSDSSSSSAQVVEQPRGDAPPFEFTGIRKIHPNQDELLASTSQAPIRASSPQKEPNLNELGIWQPSALARIANRRDAPNVPSLVEEPIDEAGELERSQESSQSPSRSSTSRRPNLSLFSAVPFSGAADWSTFGRRNKTRRASPPSREDGQTSPKNVSRTSSQSRTTPSRTPRTKNSTLSRSNSTKQPASIEQSSYSRIPASVHDNNESSPKNTEDGVCPPNAQSLQSTPSTANFQHLSVFSHAAPHDQIDSTYPPRTSVLKEETQASSSLPFTFGRQPPKRPTADNLFPSEFGDTRRETSIQEENPQDIKRSSALWVSKEASAPGGSQWPSKVAEEMIRLSLAPPSHNNPPPSEPFPKTESPTTEYPPSQPHARPRRHAPTDSDPYSSISDDVEGSRHQVPSLISDHSQSHTAEAGSSTRGWSFDPSLPNMPSFGASGDELSNPHVASSWTLASSQDSQIRSPNEERRIRSASGSSGMKLAGRRLSRDQLKDKSESAGLLPTIGAQPPVTVYTNLVPNTQDFPKTEDPAPTTSQSQNQPSSTHVDTNVPPSLSVTSPTPQPSPARSQAEQLSQLFAQRSVRVPTGHAHASGIGVAGVETHSRRQSLKVMGKRKAGEASEEDEVTVYEGKTNRPRFDSNAPSSYHRKRMKLSSEASEKDALPIRSSHSASASRSRAASTHSMTSSKPDTTGGKSRRNLSQNASMVSVPVSAIVTPRAPSVRHSVSGMSRRSDGFRYQDPLKNRVQHRAKQEVWADSWILDRDEMPIQAWLFLIGFLIAPCWWIGTLLPVHRSPPIEEGKGKNATVGLAARSNSGLWADAAEWDEARARMWRFRCFVATIISTIAYVPIIACAVVFSRK